MNTTQEDLSFVRFILTLTSNRIYLMIALIVMASLSIFLAGVQYTPLQLAGLFFFFTLRYFFTAGNVITIILFASLICYPLSLCFTNYAMNEAAFLTLSLIGITLLLWVVNRPAWRPAIRIGTIAFSILLLFAAAEYTQGKPASPAGMAASSDCNGWSKTLNYLNGRIPIIFFLEFVLVLLLRKKLDITNRFLHSLLLIGCLGILHYTFAVLIHPPIVRYQLFPFIVYLVFSLLMLSKLELLFWLALWKMLSE